MDFDPDLKLAVLGDRSKIFRILLNLLSNAIKFTPENKKVTFDVKLLNLNENTASVRFSVKDEGIGISLENQKNKECFLLFSSNSIADKFEILFNIFF